MTALSVQSPFPLITDIDGQPLEDGYIWIGTANLNPITNPIAVYWDAALTQPAAQPIRTRGGYPVNAGTPARLYVGSDYSIQVQNKNGSVIYSAPDGASDRFSSAQISFLQAGSGAVVRTAQSKMRDVVSVKDFGAVGDGVADDTVAFRAACMSIGAMTLAMAYREIQIPPGKYKLTDTIYIRAGNTLRGSGMSTYIDASGFSPTGTSPVFKTGWGLVGGVPTQDTLVGDIPPEICDMFILGGPGNAAVVDHDFPGGLIHDLWLSAPGIGISLKGGYVFDVEIDLGLNAINVYGGTNQTITNCRLFNQNYGINIFGVVSDLLIQGCMIEYAKYAGLQTSSSANGSRGITVADCDFLNNAQYSTFVNSAYLASENLEIAFNNCRFSNQKGFAVGAGGLGLDVEFKGCTFDGDKTNSTYAQSTTAGGIKFGQGIVKIQGCSFKNLKNYSFEFGTSAGNGLGYFNDNIMLNTTTVSTDINIVSTGADTLYIKGNTGSGIGLFNPNDTCLLDVKDNQKWLGAATPSGGRVGVLIPYRQAASFIASLTANFAPGSNGNYRKNHMAAVDAYVEFNGSALTSYVGSTVLRESPAVTFPVLDVQYDLDAIGGGASKAHRPSGYVCMSWPNTYADASVEIDSYSGNV
jgi:hypothetical protein